MINTYVHLSDDSTVNMSQFGFSAPDVNIRIGDNEVVIGVETHAQATALFNAVAHVLDYYESKAERNFQIQLDLTNRDIEADLQAEHFHE